jgi:hypothetical protein
MLWIPYPHIVVSVDSRRSEKKHELTDVVEWSEPKNKGLLWDIGCAANFVMLR